MKRDHVRLVTTFMDGSVFDRVLTMSETRARLAFYRDAINLTSESFTVAGAMRAIMDEQTFVCTFGTFTVTLELTPGESS